MIRLFGRLLDPDDRGPCVVTVEGETVAGIEPAPAPPADALGGSDTRLLPGLVDIQVNGALGFDFADASADVEAVVSGLARFGVTAISPTIVTSPPAAYAPALARLRRAHSPGRTALLGVHVEGPFLSPAFHGTHDPSLLRLPDIREASAWLEAGDVAWVTLAPELAGALELVEFLVRAGVVVSLGHTDATWAAASAAADAGATLATHLLNAMRPFRGRDPGVAGFVLASPLRAGIIADGNHLAFETIRALSRCKGPDELLVVTDALAGLGMPPGRHRVGGLEYVSDGTCGRLPDGTLSGSLLPLNRAVANLVDHVGLDPATAVRMATRNPARALGVDDAHGSVRVGGPADIVIVDEHWDVLLTLIGGAVAFSTLPGVRADRGPLSAVG